MNILIVGFQRSGTTLLRRIFLAHPNIRTMFHEKRILTKRMGKELMNKFIESNPGLKDQNWGEKVPFYGEKIGGVSVVKYCRKWNEVFGENGRVVFIIRHPYDCSLSIFKKYKNENNINKPLKIFNNIMIPIIEALKNDKNIIFIKYEDLLTNPDKVCSELFSFCNLSDIKITEQLSKVYRDKYKTINSSRIFAYKKITLPKIVIDLKRTILFLNSFGNLMYTI